MIAWLGQAMQAYTTKDEWLGETRNSASIPHWTIALLSRTAPVSHVRYDTIRLPNIRLPRSSHVAFAHDFLCCSCSPLQQFDVLVVLRLCATVPLGGGCKRCYSGLALLHKKHHHRIQWGMGWSGERERRQWCRVDSLVASSHGTVNTEHAKNIQENVFKKYLIT